MDAAVQLAKTTEPSPTELIPTEPGPTLDAKKTLIENFGWLPCNVSFEISAANFTVGDLLRLDKGSIVETRCAETGEIPLRANGLLIALGEFEVIENRLAVRITAFA
jgi:flagellar motor switch/type III secretory pathway protein FliN